MPSARKLIFLDIDGTLVPAGSNVPPPSALAAIAAAQRAGHLVAVCTGRSLGMAARVIRTVPFDAVVASAGGYIKYGDTVLFDHPMREEQRAAALAAFTAEGIGCVMECLDWSYADDRFFFGLSGAPAGGSNSEQERWRASTGAEMRVRPKDLYAGEPVYKISFMDTRPHTLTGPEFDALRKDFNFVIHDAGLFGAFNGEIINRAFNKGDAVRRLAAAAGVPLANTVAFGDSMNDAEMLATAALGICMGNGSDRLKAVADEVCGAVEEDGLYNAFAAHGLLG